MLSKLPKQQLYNGADKKSFKLVRKITWWTHPLYQKLIETLNRQIHTETIICTIVKQQLSNQHCTQMWWNQWQEFTAKYVMKQGWRCWLNPSNKSTILHWMLTYPVFTMLINVSNVASMKQNLITQFSRNKMDLRK